MSTDKTPRELGFRMPAEWEKHSAVWLAWPHDRDSFPYLPKAEAAFAQFIKEISEDEGIELLILDERMKSRAADLCKDRGIDLDRINFHFADYADIWIRDYGPIFVVNSTPSQSPPYQGGERGGVLAMVKWVYNALGHKYEPLLKDNEIPRRMKESLSSLSSSPGEEREGRGRNQARGEIPWFEPSIVLEGGSIEVNGQGTLMTTESCLLNKNRNPNLSKAQIEQYLSDYLGVSKIIWLKQGIEGDDTDGHVDDIARFVNPTTVLCAIEENKNDANYEPLRKNLEILKKSTNQSSQPFKIISLPMPGWVGEGDRRLPASYANFYISNQKVIVPIFGKENDERALGIIREAFPDRKVVGINAFHLVFGLGTFHCMTQQQPTSLSF